MKRFVAAWVFFSLGVAALMGAEERPNVVFLFADDVRAESIFELGGRDEVATPNLDRLGRYGARFTAAYSMGSLTAPVCQAARAMLLTGRGVFEQEHRGMHIPEQFTALPEALRKAGYATFVSGKWHNDEEALYRLFEDGGTVNGNPKPHQFEFSARDFEERERFDYQGEHTTDMIVSEAMEYLDTREDDRPFFMYLAFNAAHWPWEAPWRWMAQYEASEARLPDSFRGRHPFNSGELGALGTTTEVKYIPFPRDPAKVREIIAAYYAMISHMDDAIGRLMEHLQKLSLQENTIVVFSAENGLSLGQHGLLGKQNIYESGIRVPLIFWGPGVPAGRESDAPLYLHDIYPTICDLAGVEIPGTVTGISHKPVIEGVAESMREGVLLAYKNFMRAYREGDWKLHEYHVGGDRNTLLLNLGDDPIENVNLADNPVYANVLERMRRGMQRHMDLHGDTVDLSEPDWGVEEIPEHPLELEYWERLESGGEG